jgi:hypothetical protein
LPDGTEHSLHTLDSTTVPPLPAESSPRPIDAQEDPEEKVGEAQTRSDRRCYIVKSSQKGCDREKLVGAVASLIPDKDKGNKGKARQFLIELERIYPHSKRLSDRQLLSAIRRACRKGSLGVDQVVIEIRKGRYGYRGHPDDEREIYIPMGGKPRD